MRRSLVIASLCGLFVIGLGFARSMAEGAPTATSTATSTAPTISSPYCRANVLGGVHESDRLTVYSACAVVEGTVVRAPKLNLSDGDVTFNVRPDAAYASMENAKNLDEGGLHVEVVPADQAGCTAAGLAKLAATDLGTCTGANVTLPPLNAHVRVIGPYVFDRWVGWNEVHPAWNVEILRPGSPPPPARHTFSAHLSGSAVAARKGAPRGSGSAEFTLTGTSLCWKLTRLVRTGAPTYAVLRGKTSGGEDASVRLGSTYRAKGCKTLPTTTLLGLLQQPRRFSTTIFTARYPRGAVKGTLVPTSD